MVTVLVGLLCTKPCRQPYTWDKFSVLNSSSTIVIMPHGHNPASKPTKQTLNRSKWQYKLENFVVYYLSITKRIYLTKTF